MSPEAPVMSMLVPSFTIEPPDPLPTDDLSILTTSPEEETPK